MTERPAQRGLWRAGCPANGHVRFGGRAGETGWWEHQHRAPVRPLLDLAARRLPRGRRRLRDPEVRPSQGPPPRPQKVQTGPATTGDGGIPLVHRAYDGGAGEVSQVSQVTAAIRALTTIAGERRFLLVGDSKLVSYPNLTALTSTPGVTFLAPAPTTAVPAQVLAAQDWATATLVDHVAARDQDKPIHARATYRAREGVTTLRGPRKTDAAVTVRTVFIWSSANDQAAKAARALKLDRARTDLDTLTRAAGSHHLYRTEAAVKARLTLLATKHRVTRYLVAATSVDPDTGKPALTWHFDSAALDAEAATDGWYALLTNLPDTIGPAEVLARYKGQEVVERRYGAFKGPLAVAGRTVGGVLDGPSVDGAAPFRIPGSCAGMDGPGQPLSQSLGGTRLPRSTGATR
ncbi:hypothetical protein [Frankia sp. KB5]|uniref:IS1634 family transposase n=1 Tax=Frankia sp. KB5 TaxID=683318 RepID=UPI001F53CDD5|nr:hypothetical protein [Frankia sp. KB5]